MADGLAEALLGLNVSAADSPYAVGQQAIAQATPQLITPYTSTGKAIGLSLGSVLLQSLLAYQARSSALQDTLQANTLANQMLKLQTPEERTAFIGQADVSPLIGSKLSTLATALTLQEQARKTDLKTREGLANLEVDIARAKDLGISFSKLNEFDKQREAQKAALLGSAMPTEPGTTAPSTISTKLDPASILANPEAQRVFTKPEREALAAQAKLNADKRSEADNLRKEFNALPEVKNFSLVDNAAKVVAKAVQDPSAVATQELVRRAVQLIEPGMAVREGEQAAIMASQSIPDRFKGELARALSGEGGLQEDVRQGIMRIAQRAYESQASRYKSTKDFYEGLADERGIPKNTISYIGEAAPWSTIINKKPPLTPEKAMELAKARGLIK